LSGIGFWYRSYIGGGGGGFDDDVEYDGNSARL
jgi:hypothetical protein